MPQSEYEICRDRLIERRVPYNEEIEPCNEDSSEMYILIYRSGGKKVTVYFFASDGSFSHEEVTHD